MQNISSTESIIIQPILRWAGSKKAVLHRLGVCLPNSYERYIEVFAGSACLFFKLNPKEAIIADSNKDLMNFYRAFSQSPKQIYNIFAALSRDEDTYYQIREQMKVETGRNKRAAYFLYLNRNCFNGIYRTNTAGYFNVPFSDSRIADYPDKDMLMTAAEKLKSAKIVCGDFEKICRKNVREGDFIYLDPPYYVPNTRVFKEYSGKPFSSEDFERLSNLLEFIHSQKAKFMLSYPDCNIARAIAKKWSCSRIPVKRIIGGTKYSRKGKYELIIRNY